MAKKRNKRANRRNSRRRLAQDSDSESVQEPQQPGSRTLSKTMNETAASVSAVVTYVLKSPYLLAVLVLGVLWKAITGSGAAIRKLFANHHKPQILKKKKKAKKAKKVKSSNNPLAIIDISDETIRDEPHQRDHTSPSFEVQLTSTNQEGVEVQEDPQDLERTNDPSTVPIGYCELISTYPTKYRSSNATTQDADASFPPLTRSDPNNVGDGVISETVDSTVNKPVATAFQEKEGPSPTTNEPVLTAPLPSGQSTDSSENRLSNYEQVAQNEWQIVQKRPQRSNKSKAPQRDDMAESDESGIIPDLDEGPQKQQDVGEITIMPEPSIAPKGLPTVSKKRRERQKAAKASKNKAVVGVCRNLLRTESEALTRDSLDSTKVSTKTLPAMSRSRARRQSLGKVSLKHYHSFETDKGPTLSTQVVKGNIPPVPFTDKDFEALITRGQGKVNKMNKRNMPVPQSLNEIVSPRMSSRKSVSETNKAPKHVKAEYSETFITRRESDAPVFEEPETDVLYEAQGQEAADADKLDDKATNEQSCETVHVEEGHGTAILIPCEDVAEAVPPEKSDSLISTAEQMELKPTTQRTDDVTVVDALSENNTSTAAEETMNIVTVDGFYPGESIVGKDYLETASVTEDKPENIPNAVQLSSITLVVEKATAASHEGTHEEAVSPGNLGAEDLELETSFDGACAAHPTLTETPAAEQRVDKSDYCSYDRSTLKEVKPIQQQATFEDSDDAPPAETDLERLLSKRIDVSEPYPCDTEDAVTAKTIEVTSEVKQVSADVSKAERHYEEGSTADVEPDNLRVIQEEEAQNIDKNDVVVPERPLKVNAVHENDRVVIDASPHATAENDDHNIDVRAIPTPASANEGNIPCSGLLEKADISREFVPSHEVDDSDAPGQFERANASARVEEAESVDRRQTVAPLGQSDSDDGSEFKVVRYELPECHPDKAAAHPSTFVPKSSKTARNADGTETCKQDDVACDRDDHNEQKSKEDPKPQTTSEEVEILFADVVADPVEDPEDSSEAGPETDNNPIGPATTTEEACKLVPEKPSQLTPTPDVSEPVTGHTNDAPSNDAPFNWADDVNEAYAKVEENALR